MKAAKIINDQNAKQAKKIKNNGTLKAKQSKKGMTKEKSADVYMKKNYSRKNKALLDVMCNVKKIDKSKIRNKKDHVKKRLNL